ncbi:MAG: FxSxx-COOH system tetratricopeptide repeat protein [Ktedonobacteraceae bacterium]
MVEKKSIPRVELRNARLAAGLSQAELAKRIGVGVKTVERWEHGTTIPYPHHRPLLAKHLRVTEGELESWLTLSEDELLQLHNQQKQFNKLWVIPHQPNPFFTGRQGILDDLRSAFIGEEARLPRQVLIGQPGIGKTQVAVEYVCRYSKEYQAILWVTADTRDILISDYLRLAAILDLPEKDDPDKQRVIDGVKQWLNNHQDWLLVVDNADDPNLLGAFLPQEGQGHVLFTARDPEVGTRATTIVVGKMEREDGATLLLRRAGIVSEQGRLYEASSPDREKALKISEEMDGHPLALDQAGAFIAETGCTVGEYLDFYHKRRDRLLHERGRKTFGHPSSLASTILLSFELLEQVNPVAANMLRMCAFLHPDDIPEELFTNGDFALPETFHPVASDAYFLAEAMGALVRYSFLQQRAEEKTVSVHRLVQEVIKGRMNDEMQFDWVRHVILVVAQALPRLERATWKQYQRYISHAILCLQLIEEWQMYQETTVSLMIRVGAYLHEIASYTRAEPICRRALQLAQTIVEPEHLLVILATHNVAMLYERWGDYEQAESYYLEAISACSRSTEPNTLTTANILNGLAHLYMLRGKYAQAESAVKQALSARESIVGPDDPMIASSLSKLAELYSIRRQFVLAEPLLQRALAIRERWQETDPLALAQCLNSHRVFYVSQGKYRRAMLFCEQAVKLMEQERGPRHPDVANICCNAAEVYRRLGEHSQAEHYGKRAMAIIEEAYGAESVQTVPVLYVLAAIDQKQGRYAEAGSLFERAIAITEEKLGCEHPSMGYVLSAYALLLREMERYDEADELDDEALHITRLWLQEASPLAMLREEYAMLQRRYLRKGLTVIYNGTPMPVEEYLALQEGTLEDEETASDELDFQH